jgi:hypothetical protein
MLSSAAMKRLIAELNANNFLLPIVDPRSYTGAFGAYRDGAQEMLRRVIRFIEHRHEPEKSLGGWIEESWSAQAELKKQGYNTEKTNAAPDDT